MPATSPCNPCCSEPQSVNIPGVQGAAGVDGANGQNAYTETNGAFNLPAIVGDPVTFSVLNSDWMSIGQVIVIEGPAHLVVTAKPSSTSVTATYEDYPGDVGTSALIASGSSVSPAGVKGVFNAPVPATFTDNTVDTVVSDTIAAPVGYYVLAFQLHLNSFGVGAADALSNYVLGHRFKILAVDFVTSTVGTGPGASLTFNLEIGSTNLTGGVVNPTLASTGTVGAITAGTVVTGNNIGTASDALSIELAAGGTVFTNGVGSLLIKVQNLDTADAVASLAAKVNDIIAGF